MTYDQRISPDVYRRDIDGLRAFAVLSVVIFHAFPELLPGGFAGVDVFFVISGYLISGLISKHLAEDRFTFTDFYARRIKRILPALLIVLAACYVFGWFVLLPNEYKQLSKHIAAGIAFISNFALWSEAGYFDVSATSKPLLHLWSLGVEEQFYLIWPLALWLFAKWQRSALPLIIAVGVISFAINLATVWIWPTAAFYSPLSRFWELQLGCLLAALMLRYKALPLRITNTLSITGAIVFFLSVILLNDKLVYPWLWALCPVGSAFFLIASGPESWFNRNVLARPVLVWIGLISYPLYLWHWPLLSFAWISTNDTPTFSVRIATVLASAVLAAATYVFIEKPIRFGEAWRFKISAIAIFSLIMGTVGYVTYWQDGLPTRFPIEIRTLSNFRYEYQTGARSGHCWLEHNEPASAFAPYCTAMSEGHDRVVIWGDSHAAQLYPGLKEIFGDTIALSQFNRSSCPPILDFGFPLCRESNRWVLSEIKRIQPQTVILFAWWSSYQPDWEASSAKVLLFATVDALQNAGVGKIVVIGPAPNWKGGLPKLMYEAWAHGQPLHKIPERLAINIGFGADNWKFNSADADQQLRNDFLSQSVIYSSFLNSIQPQTIAYFSAMDFLCTQEGCLTHVPGCKTCLLAWDYGHLTTDGAAFVARQLALERVLP